MLNGNIPDRSDEYNDLLQRWQNFFNSPMVSAIRILRKELKWSYSKLAQELYNGKISSDGVRDFFERNQSKKENRPDKNRSV